MKTFELKEEHIKLLQNMYWRYSDCETGGPEADSKRPYGNSYVPPDVAEILGVELSEDDDKYDEQVKEIMQFHYDSHIALDIILQTKSFKLGTYKNTADAYGKSIWKFVK